MSASDDAHLNERAQHLLKVLVQRHIRDGQPIGSRTLTRDSGLALSPATIRNVMADLEELGYVHAPHTSAGRVPTDKGYRFFVDSLLTVERPALQDLDRELIRLDASVSTGALVDSVSNLLSGLTRMAGLVTLPRREIGALRQIEFIPLSGTQVLSILVVNEKEVQNRVIQTDRLFSGDELREVGNYLTEQFAGKDVRTVRESVLKAMQQDREQLNDLMASAVEVAQKLFATPEAEPDYVVHGQTHLMEAPELASVDKLRDLFEAFGRKQDILQLLDKSLQADGVQIFIGQESGYRVFDGVSLITSTYQAKGEVLGVLGVIGPTRMPYERVIPIVDMTARLLGSALNQTGSSPDSSE